MKYELYPDVVLNTICGEQFLIAAGKARGRVPYIEGITKPGAYFWTLLESGMDIDDIIKKASEDYNTPIDKASEAFWKFARSLEAKGYLSFNEN